VVNGSFVQNPGRSLGYDGLIPGGISVIPLLRRSLMRTSLRLFFLRLSIFMLSILRLSIFMLSLLRLARLRLAILTSVGAGFIRG
jgi:hypothetical protein